MSRYPCYQDSSLPPYSHKWVKIIDHHWEETWQIVVDRDRRISNYRSFAVNL